MHLPQIAQAVNPIGAFPRHGPIVGSRSETSTPMMPDRTTSNSTNVKSAVGLKLIQIRRVDSPN